MKFVDRLAQKIRRKILNLFSLRDTREEVMDFGGFKIIDLGYNKIEDYSRIIGKDYLVAYVNDEMLDALMKYRRGEIKYYSEVLDKIHELCMSICAQKKRFRDYKGITLITTNPPTYEEVCALRWVCITHSHRYDYLLGSLPLRVVSKKELEERGIDYQSRLS